jgi:hypothetical protein
VDQAIASAIDHHVQAEQHPGDEDDDGQAGTLAPVGSQARKINNCLAEGPGRTGETGAGLQGSFCSG